MCHLDYWVARVRLPQTFKSLFPRTSTMKALVLSGGGGFGAYQVGAWQALAGAGWHPDVVLGTSIGAVNSFLVSRGIEAEEMRRLWLELPAEFSAPNGRVRWYPYAREIPRFRAWTAEITRRFANHPLRCGLRVCMAELTGAMRVVEDASVGEQHLLAACALPGIMPPVRVDGRICLDAGTLYHVPLKEAVATGADEIIAVDLFRGAPCSLPRVVRLTTLWVRNLLRRETHEPAAEDLARVRLRYLGHEQSLGTMRECFEWNPSRVERWIELGYRDTIAALEARYDPV
jgi:predicted acylesterase/phospholipase RssA